MILSKMLDRAVKVVLPECLYKMRRVDANSLSMLASNSLFLAPVESFNDPYEVLFSWLNFRAEEHENPELAFCELDQQYRATPRHAALRVCALTEVSDDVVMWGHYADCHKGFAIQFDFRNDKLANYLLPVSYSSEIPTFAEHSNSDEAVRLGLFTKAASWSYEKEWRILGHVSEFTPAEPMTMQYQTETLIGIIFGMRMPEDHKALIRQILAGNSKVRYMQAWKSHSRFSVAVREAK